MQSLSTRRDLLKSGAILIGSAAAAARFSLWANPTFSKDPFTLGVASGDPWPDGVVLWTRLAPEPLQPTGGMPPETVRVQWRVATDEGMRDVVQQGVALASPEAAHSVHAEVHGLKPASWYWYRFDAGGVSSPVGRTRTAPLAKGHTDRFRFAFVCCQKYETGYYTAFDHLAEEDLDLVIHLGDYIYEKGPVPNAVRPMPIATSCTLDGYRARYAYYKMDPSLRRAHERFPWAVVPDDHEVENNYAGLIPEKESHLEGFAQQRTAAYQAYYEHMPLRPTSIPRHGNIRLYRTLPIGALADIHMLDTRQFRTDQPCGDGTGPSCPQREGPSTMFGDEQEEWLYKQLGHKGGAQWNILAQQVIFSQIDMDPGPGQKFMMDKWDGYPVARKRVVDFLNERKIGNVVILSGDNHNNWAFDVKLDADNEKSATVAAEFSGTSITSGGDGVEVSPSFAPVLAVNPQVRFHNSQRGYVRCELTPRQWTTDYRVVPYITRPNAPVQTRASFVIEPGRAGLVKSA